MQPIEGAPLEVAPAGRCQAVVSLLSCFLGTAAVLGWVLRYSHYGLDFTDESFYLVWIANPFLYDWSVYLFGFVYHPLYRLVQEDVAALRQANLLITFALAWLLVYVTMSKHGRAIGWHMRTALSFAFATGSLLLLDTWLPTPSYNSLAQQALLLTACGLVLADRDLHWPSAVGWLMVAVGGWLAFLGKPSTAAALAVCAPIYLLLAAKLNWRMLLLTAALALVLLYSSAVAIDGSLAKFAERLRLGIEYLGYLQGGHTVQNIFRWDAHFMSEREKTAVAMIALVLGLASLSLLERRLTGIGWLVSATLLAGILLLALDVPLPATRWSAYKDMVMFGVGAACVIAALGAPTSFIATGGRRALSLAALFLVLPHVYAFGTNGNYWQAAGATGLFWALAGLVVLLPTLTNPRWLGLLPLAVGTQFVTALIIHAAMLAPYRQPEPLSTNAHVVAFGESASELILSKDNADYIQRAIDYAQQAGFTPGTPVIDLTGQSPGILYALRAVSIGQAWTIGGYPGSAKLAIAGLRHVPCEDLARAWLLTEPEGPRKINGEVMTSFGLNFGDDYVVAASWQTARGAGGYARPRLQVLVRPVRPDAQAACLRATAHGAATAESRRT